MTLVRLSRLYESLNFQATCFAALLPARIAYLRSIGAFRSGFAARCEAGLRPAAGFLNRMWGLCPGSGFALASFLAPPMNHITINKQRLILQ